MKIVEIHLVTTVLPILDLFARIHAKSQTKFSTFYRNERHKNAKNRLSLAFFTKNLLFLTVLGSRLFSGFLIGWMIGGIQPDPIPKIQKKFDFELDWIF
jgi:hypothetical protein